jgi:hypothetical protein
MLSYTGKDEQCHLDSELTTTRLGEAGAILSAKGLSEPGIKAAEAATRAAAATPGLPAAKMAEETTKATAEASMSSTIVSRAGGADIHHNCATPLPLPPHGRLVVIGGSVTIILIKRLPASRLGDTIVETLEPPNKILAGCTTVLIGG